MVDRDTTRSRSGTVRRPRLCCWLPLAAALLGLAPVAEAGSLARAKRYFRAAEQKYQAEDYGAAAALYQKAYGEKPLPALLINIGQCQRKLGDCEKASASFRRYLAEQPEGAHRAKAEALIKACDDELAAARLLDDQQQPASPPADEDVPQPVQPPPPTPTESDGLRPLYFWSAVGLAGTMVLVGATTGGLSLKKSSQYKDPSTPAGDLPGLRDSGESLKVASNVTFTIGIAAALGATALYFFTDFGSKKERPSKPATVGAAPLVGGGGMVTLGGAF